MAIDVIIRLDDNVIIWTVTFIFPENFMNFLATNNGSKMGHASDKSQRSGLDLGHGVIRAKKMGPGTGPCLVY